VVVGVVGPRLGSAHLEWQQPHALRQAGAKLEGVEPRDGVEVGAHAGSAGRFVRLWSWAKAQCGQTSQALPFQSWMEQAPCWRVLFGAPGCRRLSLTREMTGALCTSPVSSVRSAQRI